MPPESCSAAVLKLLSLEEGIRAPVVLRCCIYLESQGSVLLQLTFLEESTPLSLANLKHDACGQVVFVFRLAVSGIQVFVEKAGSPKLAHSGPWFSTGDVLQPLQTFLVVPTGGHWHLVSRGQGCHWMSCSAPDGHSQQGTGPQCPEPQVEEKPAIGGCSGPPTWRSLITARHWSPVSRAAG